MKKRNWILVAVLCIIMAFGFAGCNSLGKVTTDGDAVILEVSSSYEDGGTLLEYMSALEDEGDLSFTISDGMVTEINGKANQGSSYWMLYTSDADNANSAWGEYEHNGEKLGSAIVGANELTVKAGCTYVWVYTTF